MNNLEETGLTELNLTELKETEGGRIDVLYNAGSGTMWVVFDNGDFMKVTDGGVSYHSYR